MSSPAPSSDVNPVIPPPDQTPAPDSTVPSPTGFSWRDSPKLLAFAGIMTLITALYFDYLSFPLDPPSLAVVAAVWLIAGWGLRRMIVYWKSNRKARH
jgi:hypothetical protein